MNKKNLTRMVVVAFILCMVSTYLLSGTLARYASNAIGTGTVNVAAWTNIKFNGSEAAAAAEFNFDLSATKEDNRLVKSDRIGPGDKGSFTFTVGPAEVEYEYSAIINETVPGTVPVSFYADSEMTRLWSPIDSNRVLLSDAGTTVTETVYWKWTSTDDATDTTLGVANGSPKFTITLNAQQVLPTDSTPEP